MSLRQIIIGFGMLFVALGLGVLVMLVAQDTQRLQREQAAIQARIESNTERLRVLEAEWAYLTRPAYLLKTMQTLEPDAGWMPVRGEAMSALDDYTGANAAPRVASAKPGVSPVSMQDR